MAMSLENRKAELRLSLEEAKRRHELAWYQVQSRLVLGNLLALPTWQEARRVAVYLATRREVQTGEILLAAWQSGKTVFAPVYRQEIAAYGLVACEERTPVRRGAFGINEPLASGLVNPSEIELVLVPGVGFDRAGSRLGRGGGYYDRLLAEMPGAKKVGLAFSFQVVPEVPVGAHDLSMDYVVTENAIIACDQEKAFGSSANLF